MKNVKFLLFAVLFSSILAASQGFAEVILEPLKGSLVITSPDGTVKLLDFGETVPPVSSSSKIEVFQGQMKISVTGDDSASWSCGGNSGSVSGGASVTISCSDSSGLLEVTEGELTYTDTEGVTHTVKAGESADLKVVPQTAPPAAANDESGGDTENNSEDPDSRSVEASVSQ